MNIPYIRYIEAMLVAKQPIEELHDKVSTLPVSLGVPALEHIYYELKKQKPTYFDDDSIAADPDWLEELGISKMFSHITNMELPEGTAGIEEALEISEDPIMYKVVTSLCLTKINDDDIEMLVNSNYNTDYSYEGIKEFIRYFFDIRSWTLKKRQDYVKSVQDSELKKYYKIALKGDKEYLLWKLGAEPDKEFDEMLKDMTRDTYYLFKEKSKSNPDEAQKWGTLAARLASKIDKLEKRMGKKDDMIEEVEFKIKRFRGDDKGTEDGGDNIPHIDQLND